MSFPQVRDVGLWFADQVPYRPDTGGALVAGRMLYKKAMAYVSDNPATIEVYQATEQEVADVKDKCAAIRNAVESGEGGSFAFTADEFNTLIASEEKLKELRGKLFVKIDNNVISAEGSVPLEKLEIGPLKGKYLNGNIGIEVKTEHGRLKVFLTDVVVNGESVPESFLKELRKKDLAAELYANRDPKTQEAMAEFEEKVEKIDVADGKLAFTLRVGKTDSPVPDRAGAEGTEPADKDGEGTAAETGE